jgi:hypothetical protein
MLIICTVHGYDYDYLFEENNFLGVSSTHAEKKIVYQNLVGPHQKKMPLCVSGKISKWVLERQRSNMTE